MTGEPAAPPSPPGGGDLAWEIDVSLFRQYRIASQFARLCVATWVVMAVLFTFIAVVEGDIWDVLPQILGGAVVAAAGFWVLGMAVSAIILRGHIRMRFEIDGDGVRAIVVDRVVRAADRAAIVAGAAAGSPSTAGAGMVATSREVEQLAWSGAFRAVFHDRRREIAFRNAWRTILLVYGTAASYPAARAAVEAAMGANGTAARASRARSPVWWGIGGSAAVVLGSLLLVPAVSELDVDPFALVLIACFSAAGVWLVGLLSGVSLVGLVVAALPVIVTLAEGPNEDEVASAVCYVAGAVVLGTLAVRAIRGWSPSVLELDFADGAPLEAEV
ncbi:MAG TPA: hypothetical protein VES19_13490 [Candidatus Limnocylindrales bacterium]|nr:hypothetical protein [Candidatus Limnocylindrales bacterium]